MSNFFDKYKNCSLVDHEGTMSNRYLSKYKLPGPMDGSIVSLRTDLRPSGSKAKLRIGT